jgi:hypothetical protein
MGRPEITTQLWEYRKGPDLKPCLLTMGKPEVQLTFKKR